jgi:hypothetical protein
MLTNCRPGLDSRCRDKDGEIRHKNGATRVGTLRQTDGDNFAPGVRSDMKLDTLLDRTRSKSLSHCLRSVEPDHSQGPIWRADQSMAPLQQRTPAVKYMLSQ